MAARGGGSLALRCARARRHALDQALKVVGDGRAPTRKRLRLLQILAEVKRLGPCRCCSSVERLATQAIAVRRALATLQPYDDPAVARDRWSPA